MSFEEAATRFQRGDAAGAEAKLRDVLAREPKSVDALHLSAVIRHTRGDLVGAAELFEAAFKLAPNDAALAFNRAAVFAALKRHRECAAAAADVLRLRPGDQEALLLQGTSLTALGEHERALECLANVTLDRPTVHTHRATSLLALGRHEEALQASHRAVLLAPNDADARYLRGSVLLALDRGAQALSDFETALAVAPGNLAARAGRASALCAAERQEEALAEIDAVLMVAPDRADYHALRGVILSGRSREEEATAAFERSLSLRPEDSETPLALADSLLAQGDFARGLPAYEARFRSRTTRPAPPSEAPLWAGEDLSGKTLLLQGEQGFGDLFQFCRFAPILAARGARVVLQERSPTLRLLQSLVGVDQLVSADEPAPSADYRLPLLSAMHVLGIRIDTIPAPIPYLSAEPDRVAHWRARLPPAKRRIGVVWSGSRAHSRQGLRSFDDAALAQLLEAEEAFVSLQIESHPAPAARGVPQFGAEILDFAETAALIENVDLVISIDTGLAHLAGALGKPVWIMLPLRADWRWMRERSDTPWYPKARLFRQTKPGDWTGVVARVHAALQE